MKTDTKRSIATRLGIRLALVVAAMFASLPLLALAMILLGEPPWLLVAFPLIWMGSMIVAHTIVVCPYCGTFDPVGWMTGGLTMTGRTRTKCPTCRARMDKPFEGKTNSQ
jgi:hypothetical protein